LATVGLPVFFVYTGVRTSFTDVSALTLVVLAVGVTALAAGAKAAGALLGAWRAGLGLREGSALALLLNTRGVTELFILNVGLDAHLVTPALFSAFVVMAVITTVVTGTTLGRIKLPEPRVRTTAVSVAGRGLGYQRAPR
jgi:Kef-type K+ transport system membrane component KefB